MNTEMKAFTIRIPSELADLIETRAKVHRRSRNNEVIALLEKAIDSSVTSDLDIIQRGVSGRT